MKSLIFGVVLITAVLVYSLHGSNTETYLQWHSIVIVFGGTLAIFFYATPNSVIVALFHSIGKLIQVDESFEDYNGDLQSLIKNRQKFVDSKNGLIKYASELWEQGIDPELFIVLVSQKRSELEAAGLDSVQSLKNLAKYPPALGMAGTVMGMIALFANLDSNKENVGSMLALAMTATFFGLIFTNVLIGPLADRLQVKYVHQKRLYSNIYQVLLLINRDEAPALISEELENKVA